MSYEKNKFIKNQDSEKNIRTKGENDVFDMITQQIKVSEFRIY